MRLTLRTMLAYMDDILEPDDAESIGKKIEESEFATSLAHRTRDCVRRLRLGAPPLMGRGIALDANSVAEYLDNTLASERVPEFEKVCLESDVHLAEVASCHQILTLVLGEPAEVDVASRERMYQIIARVDAATPMAKTKVAAGTHASPSIADGPPVIRRPKPEVPDYLRATRSRVWTVAAAVLVAALLTLGVLAMLSPQSLKTLARAVGIQTQGVAEPDGPADRQTKPEVVNSQAGAEETEAEPPDPAQIDESPSAPSPDVSDEEGNMPNGDEKQPVPDETSSGAANDGGNTGLTIPRPGLDEPTADVSPPEPSLDAPDAPVSGDAPAKPAIGPNEGAATEPAAGLNAAAVNVGRYVSGQDVLLKFDRDSAAWRRLPATATLMASDRLVSFPSFKPIVALTTSINVQPVGPTLMELDALDDRGIPGVNIEYGRVNMLTVGKAGNKVRLRFGDRQGVITFGDAESALLLEVARVLTPGKDPEAGQAPIAADLYARSGQIQWEEDGASVKITEPEHKALTALPVVDVPTGELPKWLTEVESNKRGPAELERALERALAADQPIALVLKELAGSRQREVRSVAIRCAGYVDQFEPLVGTLMDTDEKVVWPLYIETLKAALARSPDVAAQVRGAFEKQRGVDDGRALYRMLWGYSLDDLKGGAAKQLVEYLNHDSLDFRVLSIWNLKAITGKDFGTYNPAAAPKGRRASVLRWQKALKDGEILPKATAQAGKSPAKAGGGRPSQPSERATP